MKRKVIRAITGLLCAAMVFSNVAGMSVYAMEDGAGQEMQESISGNDDTGEVWEEPEEAEQESADSDAAPEEPAEPIDSNKEEDGQENREAEDEAAETVPEDLEDPDETETVSENTVEGEGFVDEEIEEESMVFLMTMAEKSVAVKNIDSTYTDGNGVIYHYYGYDDGTAEIYELENCMESSFRYKALDIPAYVGDYTVTRLTFTFSATTQAIPSVTISETVTYMRESLFKFMTILELHYYAEAAETGAASESDGVFFRGDIRKFELGGNVRSIPDYCFSWAKITMEELNLDLERIGRQAFYHDKTITTLTIGENVKEIGYQAFMWNDIENIIYNAMDATLSSPYGQLATGPFGYTSVSSITFGDKVTVIPENLFCNITYTADTLVFPDCLTTVGASAFYGNKITIGELTMTMTVIVFFHAVIIVENESVFPKAEKYPPIIFNIPTTRQLTGEKILKQHRNATTIIYCTSEQRKRDRKGEGGCGIMKLSRYEQETIVNYNAGEQTATVYIRDKAVMRKLDTLVADFPDTYNLLEQDEVSKIYSFPKAYISYRKPKKMSEEQREQARERMRKINSV